MMLLYLFSLFPKSEAQSRRMTVYTRREKKNIKRNVFRVFELHTEEEKKKMFFMILNENKSRA